MTEDTTTYTISVHVQNRLVTASYDLDKVQSEPPVESTEVRPVSVSGLRQDPVPQKRDVGESQLTISKSKPVP